MLKVLCLDNSELAEFEAISKGYRRDVYVEVETEVFHIYIYDTVRLKQDFDSEVGSYGFYSIEPNLVLVEEVNKTNIKNILNQPYKQKYFERLKPIGIEEFNVLKLKNI